MKIKILVVYLICFFLFSCATTGPKNIYKVDPSTGDVIVPAKYVGGLSTLNEKTDGNLIITNSSTKFVSETGIKYFDFPTSSISGVYVGDEVKLHFGKTLARWLLIGPFALFVKDKSEVMAIEFTEKEKNIVVNPIFQIKVGTGPMLKMNIQAKSRSFAKDRNWETAKATDTILAYEEFLKQHPDSEFAEEARTRLNTLEKESAEIEPPKEDITFTDPKSSMPAPRTLTARLEVNQSFAEVQTAGLSKKDHEYVRNFSLPFEEVARGLLEIAGVEIIDLNADAYDYHLIIEAIGKSKGGDKDWLRKSITAFTEAELSWRIFFKGQNLEPHKKEFSDKRAVIGHIGCFFNNCYPTIGELIDAFLEMFWTGPFVEKLGGVIVDVFNLDPVDFYLNALNNEDGKIRWRAAEILGDMGDSRAFEPLILTLKKGDYYDRRAGAIGLGKLGDSRAVEPLILALKDDDKWVIRRAAEALGKLGDSRAVEPLILALKDDDKGVIRSAANALGKLGDSSAVVPLAYTLNVNDKWVKSEVAEALGKLGDSRAVVPLIHTLKYIDKYQRPVVIEALGKLGDLRAIEHIIPWLKKGTTREKALESLIKLTGQDFGEDHKKWEKWWKENKDKYLKKA